MFLIALGADRLAIWAGAERRNKYREQLSNDYLRKSFRTEAQRYEHAIIESFILNFYWQMDTEDFVLA